MKTLLTATAAAAFAAGASILPAAAQDTPQYTEEMPAEASGDETVSGYIGKSVYDATGQEVGTIDDIVLADDGTETAILSVGGFLGIGSKKIAVPTSDLTLSAEGDGYTTSLTVEEIEAAPAYEAEEASPM